MSEVRCLQQVEYQTCEPGKHERPAGDVNEPYTSSPLDEEIRFSSFFPVHTLVDITGVFLVWQHTSQSHRLMSSLAAADLKTQ